MIIEFPQTNQICRVHWEYSLKKINEKAESLKTIEEKIVFLKTVIKALTMNNIFGFDCFVEAPGFTTIKHRIASKILYRRRLIIYERRVI